MLGWGWGSGWRAAEIKVLMQETGTSHLMAISGLHIALAASGLAAARGVQFFPCRWIGWRRRCWPAWRRVLRLADRYAATGAAHLRGLPSARYGCRETLVAVAGMALLYWRDTVCRSAGGVVAKPVAIRFAVAALIFWYQWLPLPGAGAGLASKPRVMHLQLA
jgi:competence protein ComEC